MYAIVEIAGQQFKVAKDQKLFVHRLQEDEGAAVTFENVLLIDDGSVTIGAPAIDGAAVTAKVIKHLKGDKVIVFKKKRRKGYKLRNGHRQYLTELVIESIVASGHKSTKKKVAPKAKPVKKTTKVVAAPKKETKVEKVAVVKETPKKEVKKIVKKTSKKGDDLKKVEGIGPKIAEHFNNAGIFTFEELANTEVSKLQEILTAAGPRYRMHNPGSWPKQARMAADGKWDELKAWQDAHDKGLE